MNLFTLRAGNLELIRKRIDVDIRRFFSQLSITPKFNKLEDEFAEYIMIDSALLTADQNQKLDCISAQLNFLDTYLLKTLSALTISSIEEAEKFILFIETLKGIKNQILAFHWDSEFKFLNYFNPSSSELPGFANVLKTEILSLISLTFKDKNSEIVGLWLQLLPLILFLSGQLLLSQKEENFTTITFHLDFIGSKLSIPFKITKRDSVDLLKILSVVEIITKFNLSTKDDVILSIDNNIQFLRINNSPGYFDNLEILSNRSLIVESLEINDDRHIRNLSGLASIEGLKKIILSNCHLSSLKELRNFSSIEKIDITSSKFQFKYDIMDLESTRLELNTQIFNSFLKVVNGAYIKDVRELKLIQTDGNSSVSLEKLLDACKKLKQLTFFDITETALFNSLFQVPKSYYLILTRHGMDIYHFKFDTAITIPEIDALGPFLEIINSWVANIGENAPIENLGNSQYTFIIDDGKIFHSWLLVDFENRDSKILKGELQEFIQYIEKNFSEDIMQYGRISVVNSEGIDKKIHQFFTSSKIFEQPEEKPAEKPSEKSPLE